MFEEITLLLCTNTNDRLLLVTLTGDVDLCIIMKDN